ncbi:MAG: crossover junction endodeoxyribonuclease RuvC [Candidatus Makana argininalis]
MTIILGIDPGYRITGYGILREYKKKLIYIKSGCILTKLNNISDRLKIIYSEITNIIKKFKPKLLSIEKVYICKNTNSIIKLSQARGVAIIAAINLNLLIFEYTSSRVKKLVTGIGSSNKNEVKKKIIKLFKLNDNIKNDESDALAMAIAHFYSQHYLI